MTQYSAGIAKTLVNEGLRPMVGMADHCGDRVLEVYEKGFITSELTSVGTSYSDANQHSYEKDVGYWYPDLEDAGTLGIIRADAAKRFGAFDITTTVAEGFVRWSAVTLSGDVVAGGAIVNNEHIDPRIMAASLAWIQASDFDTTLEKKAIFAFYD